MAVADNILVVGAFNTRQQWECLDGSVSAYPGDGFAPGFGYGIFHRSALWPTVPIFPMSAHPVQPLYRRSAILI